MTEEIEIMISEEEVDRRISEVGRLISSDYEGKVIHMICVLKGGTFFLCELAKRVSVPVTIDFMCASSYGAETESSGKVLVTKDLADSIEGRDVLIIEDIIDSGRTLKSLTEILSERNPASLKICTLLDKPSRRVEKDMKVDYTCFEIPDEFAVGYGLDYNEKYRNLPFIGVVKGWEI